MKKYLITALISLVSLNAYPQVTFFDFLSGDPFAVQEIIMLEPNYDSHGRIARYTLGDLMQVEYRYDEEGNLTGKFASVIEKRSYEREEIYRSKFLYDNGRLSQSRTLMQQMDIDSRIVVTYGRNSPDTIRWNIGYGGYGDQTILTLRYNGKKNLPDSTITCYIDGEESHPYRKEVFAYDRSGRLTATDTYENRGEKGWVKQYGLDVKYPAGKVVYTYTAATNIPDMDAYAVSFGFDTWEDALAYDGDDYLLANQIAWAEQEIGAVIQAGTEIFRMSLGHDRQDRITSRSLHIDGELVLEADYSYDSEGRTGVNSNITLKNIRFLELLSPFSNLSRVLGDEGFSLRYTVGYGDGGERVSEYFLRETQYAYYDQEERPDMGETAEYLGIRMTSRYGPDGRLESFGYDRWDGWGDYDESYLAEYAYTGGDQVEIIESVKYYEEDPFEYRDKTLETRDAEGRVTAKETFSWYYENWAPQTKEKFVYADGEIVYEEYLNMEEDGTVSYGRNSSYVRDGQGRILVKKECFGDGEEWSPSEDEYFVYNEAGNTVSYENIHYDREGIPTWNSRKYEKQFDESGEETSNIGYEWDYEKGAWEYSAKSENSRVNGEDGVTRSYASYTWNDGEWLPEEMHTTFTGIGENTLYESREYRWDNGRREWYTVAVNSNMHDDEGYTVDEYRTGPLPDGGFSHNARSRVKNTSDGSDRIFSRWDESGAEWEDTRRFIILYDEHDIVYTYQDYDKETAGWINKRMARISGYGAPDSLTVQSESLWDAATGSWVYHRKVEENNTSRYELPETAVSYRFDKTTGGWIPQFKREDTRVYYDDDIVFSVWDNDSGQWHNMILCSGVWGYSFYSFYQWNRAAGDWDEEPLEVDGYTFMQELNEPFTINTDSPDTE